MSLKISDKDHMEGTSNASVELIEYADFQCPYCQEVYYTIKDIQKDMGDDLKFVFRNFPLMEMHEHALHAAVASEIAASNGKFWEMHDILFENQSSLNDSDLIEYAQEIGLDVTAFREDFGDKQYYEKIEKEYTSGIENGVEGTPTLFINGEKYVGSWEAQELIDYMKSLVE